jgi:hydrogenase maturation protease
LEPTLIIGYGNIDRQDDGVAWHILARLSQRLGRAVPTPEEGFWPGGHYPHLLFALQLTPELAETLAIYQRVCFVDAHTGSVPEEVHLSRVLPEYQPSPLTHHMTPMTCLALCEALYGGSVEGILVSVRGYEFEFSRSLSSKTEVLCNKAVDRIWSWLQTGVLP